MSVGLHGSDSCGIFISRLLRVLSPLTATSEEVEAPIWSVEVLDKPYASLSRYRYQTVSVKILCKNEEFHVTLTVN